MNYDQFKATVFYPNPNDYYTVTEINLNTGDKTVAPLYETEHTSPSRFDLDDSGRFVKLVGDTTVIFQFNKEEYRNSQREYDRSVRDGVERFKEYLFDNHCTLSKDQHNVLFEKAWDNGHSGGFHEVEAHYSDLIEFAEKLLECK